VAEIVKFLISQISSKYVGYVCCGTAVPKREKKIYPDINKMLCCPAEIVP